MGLDNSRPSLTLWVYSDHITPAAATPQSLLSIMHTPDKAQFERAIHHIEEKVVTSEIDFTQQQLDGQTVSTQERVMKEVRPLGILHGPLI